MVVTMGVLVGPAAAQYLELQRDPAFRRNYEPLYAARLGDFRHPSPSNRLLGDAPVLRNDSAARSSESYAFPGLVTLIAGAMGVAVFARRRSWQRAGLDAHRRHELALMALAARSPSCSRSGASSRYWLASNALKTPVTCRASRCAGSCAWWCCSRWPWR